MEIKNENQNNGRTVPKRILASLISSVSAGVVPRSGAPYIAIGRTEEIKAFLSDLELIAEGGGSVRFLVGRYGSGKSFLIQLVRGYALERDFVCADADLSPERRLYGTGGTGVATYRELIKNMSVKSSPDGGGLVQVISKLIYGIRSELSLRGIEDGDEGYTNMFAAALREKLSKLEFLVGGFDFAKVITGYYIAEANDDREKMSACLRWLRGEFSSKTEARNELGFGVSDIIGDANWYDYLKLWAGLSVEIGYRLYRKCYFKLLHAFSDYLCICSKIICKITVFRHFFSPPSIFL
ncbi:MAG: ATP-binding protein, partial [Clostridia bacterium]|nr:ATP-binding protein [Clostridia bacterium]